MKTLVNTGEQRHIIPFMIKYLLCLLGIILAIPLILLGGMAITLPVTITGVGYLLAGLLIVSGLILTPWRPKSHYLLIAGISAFVLIAGIRVILGERNTTSSLRMITLPQGKGTRWPGYLLDEQDSLIFGEALFHQIGGSSIREHTGLPQLLHQDYSAMRKAQGIVPSPIISTYLGLQTPTAFDAIVVEPEANRHPDMGVIFLHGYMGNVTAQCWEIAQAVSHFGAVTVCPSAEWQGKWWYPEGQAILGSTFDYIRGRGIQKIYLGGFSNGGFGISRLISKLGAEDGLSGLILIDGMTDAPGIRNLGLPVLLIQGTQDERMPVKSARQIAEEIGGLGTYIEIDSDHFLIMKQPKTVQNAVETWLESQAGQ